MGVTPEIGRIIPLAKSLFLGGLRLSKVVANHIAKWGTAFTRFVRDNTSILPTELSKKVQNGQVIYDRVITRFGTPVEKAFKQAGYNAKTHAPLVHQVWDEYHENPSVIETAPSSRFKTLWGDNYSPKLEAAVKLLARSLVHLPEEGNFLGNEHFRLKALKTTEPYNPDIFSYEPPSVKAGRVEHSRPENPLLEEELTDPLKIYLNHVDKVATVAGWHPIVDQFWHDRVVPVQDAENYLLDPETYKPKGKNVGLFDAPMYDHAGNPILDGQGDHKTTKVYGKLISKKITVHHPDSPWVNLVKLAADKNAPVSQRIAAEHTITMIQGKAPRLPSVGGWSMFGNFIHAVLDLNLGPAIGGAISHIEYGQGGAVSNGKVILNEALTNPIANKILEDHFHLNLSLSEGQILDELRIHSDATYYSDYYAPLSGKFKLPKPLAIGSNLDILIRRITAHDSLLKHAQDLNVPMDEVAEGKTPEAIEVRRRVKQDLADIHGMPTKTRRAGYQMTSVGMMLYFLGGATIRHTNFALSLMWNSVNKAITARDWTPAIRMLKAAAIGVALFGHNYFVDPGTVHNLQRVMNKIPIEVREAWDPTGKIQMLLNHAATRDLPFNGLVNEFDKAHNTNLSIHNLSPIGVEAYLPKAMQSGDILQQVSQTGNLLSRLNKGETPSPEEYDRGLSLPSTAVGSLIGAPLGLSPSTLERVPGAMDRSQTQMGTNNGIPYETTPESELLSVFSGGPHGRGHINLDRMQIAHEIYIQLYKDYHDWQDKHPGEPPPQSLYRRMDDYTKRYLPLRYPHLKANPEKMVNQFYADLAKKRPDHEFTALLKAFGVYDAARHAGTPEEINSLKEGVVRQLKRYIEKHPQAAGATMEQVESVYRQKYGVPE